MVGHKWESAQGVVVQAQTGPPSGHGMAAAMHPVHQYVIEVRKPNGETIRGEVTERSFVAHQVGATVPVEVNSKTNEIRIDPSARVDSVRGLVNMAHQMRDAAAAGTLGGVAGMAGMAGMAGFGGGMNQGPIGGMNQDPMGGMNQGPMGGMNQGQMGGASMQVIGPDGRQVPVAIQGDEVRNLAQAMMSGDPAAKQAAMERIRQIKAQVQQGGLARPGVSQPGAGQSGVGQPAAPGGPAPTEGFSGSSGPSTFDPIGTPRTQASPGGPVPGQPGGGSGAFGEPARFGQPTSFEQPGGFGQPASFGSSGGFGSSGSPEPYRPPAPSSFGSFDTGVGQGTQQERLAKLQQLLDKGILTESEYQAQRRQVINGF